MFCELKFKRFDDALSGAMYLEAGGYDVRLMGNRVMISGRLDNADVIAMLTTYQASYMGA